MIGVTQQQKPQEKSRDDCIRTNMNYLKILIGLMFLDTVITIRCVSLGATELQLELNPLWHNFDMYIYTKIVLSIVGSVIIYIYLLDNKRASACLFFLILWYGVILIANVLQYIRWVIV